jgi:hypothetical protein
VVAVSSANESDRYLWDRCGPPDREVAALERLLVRFAHDGRSPRTAARARWPWLAGALAAAAAVVVFLGLRGGSAPAMRLLADGRALVPGDVIVAQGGDRELVLGGDVARLTLHDGGRLRVAKLGGDETRLALDEGHLRAFVSVDVRPRFFQVDTPAARCVDLGCQYDLRVEPSGDAHVVVTLGRVAFEDGGGDLRFAREVYVPDGAECFATRARGAGTPRWIDSAPTVVAALNALDSAEPGHKIDRVDLARIVFAELHAERDALIAWHLLQDPETEIAVAAAATLERLVGRAEGLDAAPGERPTAADRARWKAHLGWW